MKAKIVFATLFLIILYGVFGPTKDGREPFPAKVSDPIQITSLGIPLDRIKNPQYINKENNFKNPQDTSIDSQGNIYTGVGDGTIFKITPDRKYQVVGKSEGMILGVTLNQEKNQLYFMDQIAGVGKLDLKRKQIQILVDRQKHPQLVALNSITFDDDGVLYFTNVGKVSMKQFHREILNGHPDGAVYTYDQKTKKLSVFVDKLTFPNGIVHNKDKNPEKQCIYVAQTGAFNVLRIFLRGQKRGKTQIVVENIPAYPDNLKMNDKGQLWLATPGLRDKVSTLIDRSTNLRRFLLNIRIPLSIFLLASNRSYLGGVKIDPRKGQIVDYFYGKSDKTDFITGISEHDGKLYMSSLKNPYIMVVPYQ